jgi:molybdopterin-binding protein
MTSEAVEELHLTPGVEVVALIKAPAVIVELP